MVGSDNHAVVHGKKLVMVPLHQWLDDKERERDTLIMRLRQVEKTLVENGRLRCETLPRRVRH